MICDQGPVERRIRTIFISDVHLGSKHCRAEALLHFLKREPDSLYIVGDFIDGWKLSRSWHWTETYNQIFRRLIELANSGTRLFYAPGNHDAFLRGFLNHFGLVDVADEFVHVAADRRRYLVTHGDRFDRFETSGSRISKLAAVVYELLLSADWALNKLLRRSGKARYAFSTSVKQRVKRLVRFISDFENALLEHARQRRCHGIICGHIHSPGRTSLDEVEYFNTGDWIENCTALLEYEDGSMEIVYYDADAPVRPVPTYKDEKRPASLPRKFRGAPDRPADERQMAAFAD